MTERRGLWGALLAVTVALTGCGVEANRTDTRVQGVMIERPARPELTHVIPLGDDVLFVAQTVSFVSRAAGLASSRRPASYDAERPAPGVPAGLEWRLLWLRAFNCEAGTRTLDFAVVDGEGRHVSAITPSRAVRAGDAHAWISGLDSRATVPAGHAVAARWDGMVGDGAEGCNWQFAAFEAPAGRDVSVEADELLQVEARFRVDEPGLHASWRSGPPDRWFQPLQVTAHNCEPVSRDVRLVLLSPDNIVFGEVPASEAPSPIEGDGTLHWSDAGVILPPGWSIGVRWHGMAGNGHTCRWSALLRAVRVA